MLPITSTPIIAIRACRWQAVAVVQCSASAGDVSLYGVCKCSIMWSQHAAWIHFHFSLTFLVAFAACALSELHECSALSHFGSLRRALIRSDVSGIDTCMRSNMLQKGYIQRCVCLLQFCATLMTNIEALTGSPVNVSIASFKSGSVVASVQTDFQDNNATSAATYASVMKSGDPSSVFGTGYGSVYVDPKSVQTSQVSNPARESVHDITTLS